MFANIPSPSPTAKGYADKINIALKRMAGMIDDLLAFSRLGRKEITMADVNLNTMISSIIDHYSQETVTRDITWKIGTLPVVKGDHNLLQMAFENLISNAIKYTANKSKAEIEIGVNPVEGDYEEIYVKDNGAGFDMAYYNKLFGVFQRLHSGPEFEGTGIGLANVKQIITKHKGYIRAEGKVNEGAVFYVTLPGILNRNTPGKDNIPHAG
jgi:light-regulated signal transduction histidine kinase (bacteriophytochrome)